MTNMLFRKKTNEASVVQGYFDPYMHNVISSDHLLGGIGKACWKSASSSSRGQQMLQP